MAKGTWTNGHIHEEILDKILSNKYLSALCIQDYISSMSDADLKGWVKCFIESPEELRRKSHD